MGLDGCQEVVEYVRLFVPPLLHDLRPLVQHEADVPPGNSCFLCEAETTLLAASCVWFGDAHRLQVLFFLPWLTKETLWMLNPCFVDQALDLASSLEWAHCSAPFAVTSKIC